jgi:hypothetical protein
MDHRGVDEGDHAEVVIIPPHGKRVGMGIQGNTIPLPTTLIESSKLWVSFFVPLLRARGGGESQAGIAATQGEPSIAPNLYPRAGSHEHQAVLLGQGEKRERVM